MCWFSRHLASSEFVPCEERESTSPDKRQRELPSPHFKDLQRDRSAFRRFLMWMQGNAIHHLFQTPEKDRRCLPWVYPSHRTCPTSPLIKARQALVFTSQRLWPAYWCSYWWEHEPLHRTEKREEQNSLCVVYNCVLSHEKDALLADSVNRPWDLGLLSAYVLDFPPTQPPTPKINNYPALLRVAHVTCPCTMEIPVLDICILYEIALLHMTRFSLLKISIFLFFSSTPWLLSLSSKCKENIT